VVVGGGVWVWGSVVWKEVCVWVRGGLVAHRRPLVWRHLLPPFATLCHPELTLFVSSCTHAFEGLRALDVRRCKLTALPKSIGALKKLRNLYLQRNELQDADAQMVKQDLPNCRTQGFS
jgi:hypothetical protein